jgi:kinesin family protein 11
MSFTPEVVSRKSGVGVIPSPAPFLTPRLERRRPDSFSNRLDRDNKEVNVQVILRCKPLSEEEQKSSVPRVISCNEMRREVNVLHTIANKQVDRLFNFDKVGWSLSLLDGFVFKGL